VYYCEEVLDTLAKIEMTNSGTLDLDDPELEEMVGGKLSAFPEQTVLLDVECFEIGQARCVSIETRHRMHGAVHSSCAIFILFKKCFWALSLETEEDEEVGAREGAVAGQSLEGELTVGTADAVVDPYARKWDGIVNIEDDPLTRMRLVAEQLRNSISLGENLSKLKQFNP